MRIVLCTFVSLSLLSLAAHPQDSGGAAGDGAQADAEAQGEAAEKALTLERLFPEKRYFGPSAGSTAFSHDGRYGSWLWRPWIERRHGSDLWIHDFQTGETRRITSATVLEPFQESAHRVAEDRRARAAERAKAASEAGQGGAKDATKDAGDAQEVDGPSAAGDSDDSDGSAERGDLGDVVDEDDADREDAPRWSGVSDVAWSPVADELILASGGDLYRWKVAGGELERLTHTRARESRARWMPDGSGYVAQIDGALLRVSLTDHRVEQIDPALESGETLSRFALSPDGRKLAFLASKGDEGVMAGGRTVKIAEYEDRFMTVKEVPRHVSDDPLPERDTIVYVYELPEPMRENGVLHRLHTHRHTGFRDQVASPDWAPDSTRVAFAVYTQADGVVEVLEGILPERPESGSWADLLARAQGEVEGEKDREDGGDDAGGDRGRDGAEPVHEHPALVVYRFLHQGGPNTPSMIDPHYVADSRRILFLSEQSGFRHLGLLDPLYERYEQLTRGPFEVYLAALPEHRRFALVTSTREDSSCEDVYRVDLESGGMERLTRGTGCYSSVAGSPDGQRLLASIEAYGRLRELVAVDVAAGTEVALTDSHPPEARELTTAVPEIFTFTNRHGHTIHGMLMKPDGWKAEDRRPCLVYVYGGPLGTSRDVVQGNYSGSAYGFAWYMSKVHGYVTATIDPRGMSGYGAVFEKANYERVGKPQVEDLVDGARWLVANAGVDPKRIGLHGWSFGGFQTQMCLYTEPDVFAAGIAGAGPTEWENYNSWYSTGTIGPSRTGKPDLEKYSLLPLAKNLKSKLLLVHGMEDSNVLYQDTVRVYAALLEAGKETLVELFLDPSGGHGLGGHVKSLARYRKYEEFLLRCLGEAKG